jgi:hypothetical protein
VGVGLFDQQKLLSVGIAAGYRDDRLVCVEKIGVFVFFIEVFRKIDAVMGGGLLTVEDAAHHSCWDVECIDDDDIDFAKSPLSASPKTRPSGPDNRIAPLRRRRRARTSKSSVQAPACHSPNRPTRPRARQTA